MTLQYIEAGHCRHCARPIGHVAVRGDRDGWWVHLEPEHEPEPDPDKPIRPVEPTPMFQGIHE